MALASGESFRRGFVRNTAGALVMSASPTGTWVEGFVRDTFGRLVVKRV